MGALAQEFERLAAYVAAGWQSCGRSHAELVASGLESSLSITLEPGRLLARAEAIVEEAK